MGHCSTQCIPQCMGECFTQCLGERFTQCMGECIGECFTQCIPQCCSPDLVDTKLGNSVLPFELGRAEIAQSRVPSSAIIV